MSEVEECVLVRPSWSRKSWIEEVPVARGFGWLGVWGPVSMVEIVRGGVVMLVMRGRRMELPRFESAVISPRSWSMRA